MIGPFGSNGKAGAATGLPGKPPRTIPVLWSHSGWLTAAGRVAGAQMPALPGRAEVYLRNPSARTDAAMRWAAELGGSPPADACEGNPGEVFPGPRGGSGVSGLEILASWYTDSASLQLGGPVRNRDVDLSAFTDIAPRKAVASAESVMDAVVDIQSNLRRELVLTNLFASLGAES